MNSLFDGIKKPKFTLISCINLLFIAFFSNFNPVVSSAQDLHYSQFFNNQIYTNPAFCGLTYHPRISIFYRNQYPAISNGFGSGFNTYSLAFDQQFEGSKSAIGGIVFYDTKANSILSSITTQAAYAYQIKLNPKLGLKLGIQVGMNHQWLDWSKLQFYDQIDPINGFFNNIPTNEPQPPSLSQTTFDAGLGFLLFSYNFYMGGVIKHLTFQKNNFYNNINSSISPLYVGGQIGNQIVFDKKHKFYFSPNLMYGYQYKKHELLPMVMVNYELVNFGLGFRHVFSEFESFILYLGISKGMFRMNYSYDITISGLAGRTGGSHELCFKFVPGGEDNSLNTRHNNGRMPCPDILLK